MTDDIDDGPTLEEAKTIAANLESKPDEDTSNLPDDVQDGVIQED